MRCREVEGKVTALAHQVRFQRSPLVSKSHAPAGSSLQQMNTASTDGKNPDGTEPDGKNPCVNDTDGKDPDGNDLLTTLQTKISTANNDPQADVVFATKSN